MKKKTVRFGPEIQKHIVTLERIDAPTALVDLEGRLLWSSVQWKQGVRGEMAGWGQTLGFGWLEFVALSDVPSVKGWIKSSEDDASVRFATEHNSTPGRWLIAGLLKFRPALPHIWTVVGSIRKASRGEVAAQDLALID
jgi:hypothetical protein